MPAKAILKDIADAMSMQFDECSHWFDRQTGAVHFIRQSDLSYAEDSSGEDEEDEPPAPDIPDPDEWDVARLIVTTDRFVSLPGSYEVNEWEIMREFSQSQTDEEICNELLGAINGRGAFRMFKDKIRQLQIEKEWYAFKQQALRVIATDWCKQNNLEWQE